MYIIILDDFHDVQFAIIVHTKNHFLFVFLGKVFVENFFCAFAFNLSFPNYCCYFK